MSATSLSSVTLSPSIDIRTSECNIQDRMLSPSDFNFYACAMCIFYLYHLHSDEPNPRNIAKVDSETNEIIFLRSKRHIPGTRALVTAANVSMICNGDPNCWKLEDCCEKAVSCCEMQRNARRASYKDELVIDNRTCPEIWDGFVCFQREAIGSFGATACPDFLDHYGGNVYKKCHQNGTWQQRSNYGACTKLHHFRKTNKVGVVCKSISIAAVIPACIIMLSYRSLRQQQRIRVHLCLLATSLMLAVLTLLNELLVIQDMLHGENRDQTVLKRNPLWCGLLLLAIQYSYMALFMWMFIEFFHLHRLLVNAFAIPKSLVSYYITGFDSPLLSYCLFGFGFPFLMVSIVGIFRASNENLRKKCFDESHWIHWVMNVPNLLALTSNIFFLLRIVYILVHQLAPHPNEPSSFRRAVKAVAVLLPLLGTQYLLFIWPEPAEDVVQQIYFMLEKIVCSLHGALIALVFCYLNKEIQGHVKTPCLRLLRRFGLCNEMVANQSMTLSTQFATETRSQRPRREGSSSTINNASTKATLISLQPINSRRSNHSGNGNPDDNIQEEHTTDVIAADEATHLDPDGHRL